MAAEIPAEITLWYCPACGKQVRGDYNLDETATKCKGKWHIRTAVGVLFRRVKILTDA